MPYPNAATAARANKKLQQIQISFLIFLTKSYRTVFNIGLQAIAGVMHLILLMHQDVRAISSGHQTNAVSIKFLDIEISSRIRGIHPKYNYISVDFIIKECKADVCIYTDGSKTENHVGAGMAAFKHSRKIINRDKETEQRV